MTRKSGKLEEEEQTEQEAEVLEEVNQEGEEV